jgi:hypothetical protein
MGAVSPVTLPGTDVAPVPIGMTAGAPCAQTEKLTIYMESKSAYLITIILSAYIFSK